MAHKFTTRHATNGRRTSASRADLIHGSGDHKSGRYARTPEPQSSPIGIG